MAEIPPAEAAPASDGAIRHAERMDGRRDLRQHSRRAFLEYTPDFEARLAESKRIKPGPVIIILCGNEFAWNRLNLEDFADFYHMGRHRADDPFALMGQHHLQTNGIKLARNIDHFGF
jgi:hypothetical protein